MSVPEVAKILISAMSTCTIPYKTKYLQCAKHNIAGADAYLCTKWHLDPSTVWPQETWAEIWRGASPTFWGGELGPYLTQSRLCRGLSACQVTS